MSTICRQHGYFISAKPQQYAQETHKNMKINGDLDIRLNA